MATPKSTKSPRKAAPLSNVLPFPARPAATSAAGARKGRKPKRGNVVPFTGVMRNNYDVKTEMLEWKEAMLKELGKIYLSVSNGEITGLVIARAVGVPTDDGDPEGGKIDLLGLFANDFAYAARVSDFIGSIARKRAEKQPARAI